MTERLGGHPSKALDVGLEWRERTQSYATFPLAIYLGYAARYGDHEPTVEPWFEVEMEVQHKTFGLGRVDGVDDCVVTVEFECGQKRIVRSGGYLEVVLKGNLTFSGSRSSVQV